MSSQDTAVRRTLSTLYYQYPTLWKSFCFHVLSGIKFRKAPNCSRRLIQKITQIINHPDDLIYTEIRHLVHSDLYKSQEYLSTKEDWDRADNRIEQIRPIFQKYIQTCNNYLDIGSGHGEITTGLGKLFNAKTISGCDILPVTDPDFNFTLLTDPHVLPYETSSSDLITTMMSLHHIKDLPKMLSEIHRVLRPDGKFLIREHDVNSQGESLLLDITHKFYALVWSIQTENHWYSKYYSREDLNQCLIKAGFKTIYETSSVGVMKHYYRVCLKI